MRIYPAIDIQDGKCVRLFKGSFSEVTVYGDDPVEMAKKWESQGGEFLHVVDLDGARYGQGKNAELVRKICMALQIPVQTGGGIRTMEDIESRLSCGVSRVIIGTKAVRDEDFVKEAVECFGEKIVIGIDAKDGFAATEGWEEVSGFRAVELAKKMSALGVSSFVYTDIATDGTLAGPNVPAMHEMAESVPANVIASGGIGSYEHIRALRPTGVEGVIVGRALYTGNVSLSESIRIGKGE